MEKSQKDAKNAQIGEILAVYNALRLQNVVKSQKEFAQLLGISEQTLSAAVRGRDGYLTDKLMRKVKETAAGFNIKTEGEHSPAIVQNGNGEQKILDGNAEGIVKTLTAEMAEQRKMYAAHVDRLLGIIEKMQQ